MTVFDICSLSAKKLSWTWMVMTYDGDQVCMDADTRVFVRPESEDAPENQRRVVAKVFRPWGSTYRPGVVRTEKNDNQLIHS